MDVRFCLFKNDSKKAKQEKLSKSKNETKKIQDDVSENATKQSCIKLKKHPAVTTNRVFKSVCIMMDNLALGLSSGLNGPTLVHIEYLLHTDTQGMGFAYMTENIGYILGSITCGFVMQYCNPELLLGFMSLWVAVGIAGLPWAPNVIMFGIILVIRNVAYGFIDAGGQPYMLQLWQGHKHQAPVFNSFQCTWTLGAFISPLIVLPFLSDLPHQEVNQNSSALWNNTHTVNQTDGFFNPSNCSKTQVCMHQLTKIRYAYITVALLTFLPFLLFCVVCCLDKYGFERKRKTLEYRMTAQTERTEENTPKSNSCDNVKQPLTKQQQQTQKQNFKKRLQIVLLILLALIILFEAWINYNFNTFISAFVIKGLHWDTAKGPLVTSVCRSGEIFGQIIGIPISAKLHPRTMLLGNIAVTTVTFCLLLVAVLNGKIILFWVCVGMAGIFTSTVFGCVLLWGSYFVKVTPLYGSLFMVAVAVGMMSSAAITGYLFDNISPMWTIYIAIISSSLLIILFLSVVFIERLYLRNKTAGKEITHKTDEEQLTL